MTAIAINRNSVSTWQVDNRSVWCLIHEYDPFQRVHSRSLGSMARWLACMEYLATEGFIQ